MVWWIVLKIIGSKEGGWIATVAEFWPISGNKLNNIRCKNCINIKNKQGNYLKEQINELETSSKNKSIRDLYRDTNEFEKGYQPRTNLAKDENGDRLADSHILNTWKNYFSQLLTLHGFNYVRQKCIQLNHWYLKLVLSRLKMLLKSSKDINYQVMIRFW